MMWWSAGLFAIGAFGAIMDFRRRRDMERVLMLVAWGVFTLIGVLGLAEDLDYIPDGISYWIIDLSLFLLFAALVYQVEQHKKRRL
jgi:hypothetical protein